MFDGAKLSFICLLCKWIVLFVDRDFPKLASYACSAGFFFPNSGSIFSVAVTI